MDYKIQAENLIKEVIEREIGRGGQVFYLHNNTSDLNSIAFRIEHEIKGSKVGVIHGKMDKESFLTYCILLFHFVYLHYTAKSSII